MFFGREDVIDQFGALLRKRVASLVTCRGRRRIGKSTLVEVFAKRTGCRFIKIEGRRPQRGLSNADELATFAKQLADQTSAETTPPANWPDAFRRLDSQIGGRGWTVVLLDEVSWMAHYDKGFASDLKIAWDNLFKKHDRLVMVVCGSVSSWIRDNIIDNGAFLGRRSLDVVVRELPLSDCVKFWGKAASRIDEREIIDVISVTGGVPRYLEEIDPALSAAENIRRLCFLPNSLLRTDFDEMFNDVITQEQDFSAKVVRCLADGAKTAAEVSRELRLEKGGRVSAALARLEEAGLVSADVSVNPETGKPAREVRYRLRDNYSRFYIKYIEPVKKVIDSGAFELATLDALEGIDSVLGLAFENLVVNNCRELIPMLNLKGSLITSAAPYRRRSGTAGSRGKKGCQVDLLVQTRRTVCVVEIKRRREIDRGIIREVDEKVRAIARPTGVSARAALVYSGHLSPVVEADGYFDAIVPFRRLLGL
ncbi:MAG: hypothetical protein IJH50_12155 [Kiritimatiellae bacterium]|nr:hypothetical protein [Kiritimatiellia bacterium]